MQSILLCLCIIGSTKSSIAFDISNSTTDKVRFTQSEGSFSTRERYKEQSLTVPPSPRNKHGRLMCTKDRYIEGERQIGVVSWYGGEFHGKTTASGERFDKNANTLAHLTLPMGTRVRIENPATGAVAYARVNDCGPFIADRIADLSKGLADQLGLVKAGKGTVIITVL
jgi:rare lipoprotein A (peptidoglycan hydrolase)